MQENYLEVLDLKYYMANELAADYVKKMDDAGRTIKRLPDGQIDVIQMLYEEFPDGAVAVPPNVTAANFPPAKESKYHKEINILLAEGFRDFLSMDTTRPGRLNVGGHSQQLAYKVKVQAMLTKLPGWYFTAYQSAQFFSQQLVSETQYKALIEDFIQTSDKPEELRQNYADMINTYNFTNDIPKYKVFVKLNQTISDERRA